MAIEQLNKKTSMELREGEVIIFKNYPRLYQFGFFWSVHYNFVITNQRIALVPYKKGKEQVDIKFEDIAYVEPPLASIQRNPNTYNKNDTMTEFRLKMKGKKGLLYKFHMQTSLGEGFKQIAKEILPTMKEAVLGMAEVMDGQARSAEIDRDRNIRDEDKYAAKAKAWTATAQEWQKLGETPKGKGGPSSSATAARNIIVAIISEVLEANKD